MVRREFREEAPGHETVCVHEGKGQYLRLDIAATKERRTNSLYRATNAGPSSTASDSQTRLIKVSGATSAQPSAMQRMLHSPSSRTLLVTYAPQHPPQKRCSQDSESVVNDSSSSQQMGQVNLVMGCGDAVRLVVDLDTGLATGVVSAVVRLVIRLRPLDDDLDAVVLDRELEVDAGGDRNSGWVTPAAVATAEALSMYFSIKRSLFHSKWRNSKAAVLA